VFFDPALGKSVLKGSQPNTEPFGGAVPPSSSGVPTSTMAPSPSNTLTSPGSPSSFGSCSVPQIIFGVGFDNRKETSFEPADKKSYDHGSAQNIDIISEFICNTLVNSCKADQTALKTCAAAQAAADKKPPKIGAQADAFNAVFGITTNFSAITPLDDQGRPVTSSNSSSPNSSSSGTADFAKCSKPEIKFAVGLDNRKETAFAPVDTESYNHGSADNIGVITQFMCDALTNTCGANQAAVTQCKSAQVAANAATPPQTGVQADVFNHAFGLNTNFSRVTPIDNTGKPVAVVNDSPTATCANLTIRHSYVSDI